MSKCVDITLSYIESGLQPKTNLPVRTLNAVGSYPLSYRTFGGQEQSNGIIDEKKLESVFGSQYLLTMVCSGVIIRKLLYTESDSCHSLYCDSAAYQFFDKHGLVENGPWDKVEHQVLDENITLKNVDHRIYYSSVKPFAMLHEAEIAKKNGLPVLFVDADLILKKRHDAILKNPRMIRAAYGHLEALRIPCYPDFKSLHFPEGYVLPENYRMDLPAVNTCLMFFHDLELLEEWCLFFKNLFLNNWLAKDPDPVTISQQLLGIDQRTFPMVAANHGYWGTEQLEAFLDIIWDPPYFYSSSGGGRAEWHYYTLEHHPEKSDWLQDITHTWINKRDIERDIPYRNYQGCMMLEIILELEPHMEASLRTFESLKPYFSLVDEYKTIEAMLSAGAVRNKLNKTC